MPDEMNGVRVLIRGVGQGVGQKDPDVDNGDLAGRADIAGRLDDEVEWIRQCAHWLEHLDRKLYPTMVNLRPESDSGSRR